VEEEWDMAAQNSRIDSADVVIVGFGDAAIATAITAHDEGAEVVLLEKMPRETAGGNSRVSGQVWHNPTDIDEAKVHLRSQAQGFDIPEDIVDAWALETSKNTEWMKARLEEVEGDVERDPLDPYGQGSHITKISAGQEMGGRWNPDIPDAEFYEIDGNDCGTEWYYIGPSQGFSRVWHTLRACVEKRGIPVLFEHAAKELVQESDGAITGVVVDTPDGEVTISARRAVVLACGGFENNPQMVREYLRLETSCPWGSPANTGDGHRMALKVGADLWHMTNYMGITGLRIPEYGQGEWVEPIEKRYILVGKDGKRFMDDSTQSRHGKAVIRGNFDFFPGFDHYMIFDEEARLAGPLVFPNSDYAANWMKQVHRYNWSKDSSVEIEKGWIEKADTPAELAEKLGIDPEALQATIAEWNAYCEQGKDLNFSRDPKTMRPLQTAPYYGYRWGGVLINTVGGPRKDAGAHVLDAQGEPIPGLYVAGEISGTNSWIIEGGQSIGDAIAFGRIAARNAVREPDRSAEPAGTTAG
jgi:succinate dehydrogenase/fumarate reductase flavoprotein subunit